MISDGTWLAQRTFESALSLRYFLHRTFSFHVQNTFSVAFSFRRPLVCKLTYLLYGAESWFAASQEIPRISRNPKVHYRTHKRPPPVPVLGQPNPVHIPISHLLQIHPNIIHSSTPRSLQWSPSFRFPHQDPNTPLSSPIRATYVEIN